MTVYRLIFLIISPILTPIGFLVPSIREFVSVRLGWKEKIDQLQLNREKVIWIHAASLGEFEQGRPIIERIRTGYADFHIHLTFFSSSGYKVRKDYQGVDSVGYLPIDTTKNARQFIEILNPVLAVFVKYDFWLNHLDHCQKRGIPILVVSARFRASQAYFKTLSWLYLPIFRKVSQFFVQDQNSVNVLQDAGIQSVQLAGDTRMDRVIANARNADVVKYLDAFCADNTVMVLGSTWSGDIELMKSFIKEWQHKFKFIIAPHKITNDTIGFIESNFESTLRYSFITDNAQLNQERILILDNVGILAQVYQYARYAYVGGSRAKGLHNILEPTAFAIPILFASDQSNKRYPEAADSKQLGFGFEVKSPNDPTEIIQNLEGNSQAYEVSSRAALDYVEEREGATDIIFGYIQKIL